VGKPTIKKLKLREHCPVEHFEVILKAATNLQALSVVTVKPRIPGICNPIRIPAVFNRKMMALAGYLK